MAATHGTLGPFDLHFRDWKSYVERAKLYFTANDIADAAKQRAVLLSSCGEATYRRIKDVLSPLWPNRRCLQGHLHCDVNTPTACPI